MLFYSQSTEGASSGEQLGQITLPQFRGLMTAARAVTSRFPAERVDEIFTAVATSSQTLARKVDSKNGVSTFDLLDFMIATVHVAHARFAAENASQVHKASSGMHKISSKCLCVCMVVCLQTRA